MLVIALLVLWNSFLLWITIGAVVWWLFLPNVSFYIIGLGSLLLTTLLAVLAASPIGDTFLRLPLSCRRPIERERKRLEPLLNRLRHSIKTRQGRFIVCKLLMTEVAYPYIQTLGRCTLILPRHLLDALTDDALMSGIASAMGRFYDRHSMYYSMSLGASFLNHLIQNILRWVAATITHIGYRYIWLLPLGLLGSLLSLLLKGLQITTTLIMKAYIRRRIYVSDRFSELLGLRTSLITYLEILAQQETREDGFLEKYQQRFPSAMQRIGTLESLS